MAGRAAWGLATLLALASPALAQECRLALVLALDVSSSVDRSEDRFQREGLARALMAPEVVRAFLAGAPVALYVFEWSGPFHHVTLPPGWQMVETEEDLTRIAASCVRAVRPSSGKGSSRGDAVLCDPLIELRFPVARGICPDAPNYKNWDGAGGTRTRDTEIR